MSIRNAGLAIAITLTVLIGALHALVELTLATRPRLEHWQARRAYGTGIYPRDRRP